MHVEDLARLLGSANQKIEKLRFEHIITFPLVRENKIACFSTDITGKPHMNHNKNQTKSPL